MKYIIFLLILLFSVELFANEFDHLKKEVIVFYDKKEVEEDGIKLKKWAISINKYRKFHLTILEEASKLRKKIILSNLDALQKSKLFEIIDIRNKAIVQRGWDRLEAKASEI